jgi:hypothetical protein
MATADRMTPEAGKDVVLVLAVSGKRSRARQKGQNLRGADRVAFGIPVSMSEELTQQVRSGRELGTMGLSPEDVLLDRLVQRHARPSRSRAATSRRAARLTLA